MGAVAEFALQHKAQNPLSASPLEAFAVYDALRRISKMRGSQSLHRMIAALRGLMMSASPLEGKYIVRTALGNTAVGLGPRTIVEALSQSFRYSGDEIIRAYNLMPDPGMLAMAAMGDSLSRIKIQPPRPVRPMLLRQGNIRDAALPAAYLPLHQGLKVQVHIASGQISVYTARLKDITVALASMAGDLQDLKLNHEMVLEAQLMGFLEGRAVRLAEVVRHINRRHFARRSRTEPALMAYDILYLDGEDLTGLAYRERRRMLIDTLGAPRGLPFHGISPAKEMILEDAEEAKTYFDRVKGEGCSGLMVRDLRGLYSPGCYSSSDLLLRNDDDFKAL
jgi:DNA ligase-1